MSSIALLMAAAISSTTANALPGHLDARPSLAGMMKTQWIIAPAHKGVAETVLNMKGDQSVNPETSPSDTPRSSIYDAF